MGWVEITWGLTWIRVFYYVRKRRSAVARCLGLSEGCPVESTPSGEMLRCAAHHSSGHPARADDKSLGCGAYKIEWVTGHQGQDCVIGMVQHFSVLGLDDFSKIHAIAVRSV